MIVFLRGCFTLLNSKFQFKDNLVYETYFVLSTVSIEACCLLSDFDVVDDDEHHSNGLDDFGAKQASRVVVTPMPSTAPMERLKLQLFSTMSGLYLKSEFGWLMITAIAICAEILTNQF